jgi:hypothetical protein
MILMASLLKSWSQEPAIGFAASTWTKLGEVQTAEEKTDDSFTLTGAANYNSIKLKVLDAPLIIESLIVVFDNGGRQQIDVFQTYRAGSETGVYRLENSNERIKKVLIKYRGRVEPDNVPPRVVLYGLY